MALSEDKKIKALDQAIEIAKEYANSGSNECGSPEHILNLTYDAIIKILEKIYSDK